MKAAVLAAACFGLSLASPARADCNHGNVPYDYFNANPLVIRSGITCQDTRDLQARYGGGVTSPLSNQSWYWQGIGCDAAGSGRDLAYAAAQLMIWGCESGELTNGSNGTVVPY
jgi:hypothetical protein